jgi:hypothetical protein
MVADAFGFPDKEEASKPRQWQAEAGKPDYLLADAEPEDGDAVRLLAAIHHHSPGVVSAGERSERVRA